MKRFLKWIGIGLASVMLLGLVSGIIANIVDPQRCFVVPGKREQIVREFEKNPRFWLALSYKDRETAVQGLLQVLADRGEFDHSCLAPKEAREWKPVVTTPAFAQPKDFTIALALQGGARPIVAGTTNLPEGTALIVSLSRQESTYNGQAKATVVGGKFQAGPFSQKGGPLNAGKYLVWVSGSLAALQPASVQAVIGANLDYARGLRKIAATVAQASRFT